MTPDPHPTDDAPEEPNVTQLLAAAFFGLDQPPPPPKVGRLRRWLTAVGGWWR